jgi:hypothetical protein
MIPRLKEFPASEVVENPATAKTIPTIQTTSPPRSFRFASRITSWRSAIFAASDKRESSAFDNTSFKVKRFATSEFGIVAVQCETVGRNVQQIGALGKLIHV